MPFWRRRVKSVQEKIGDILRDACNMLGPDSIIILSTHDGLLVGAASKGSHPSINDELVAGLVTLTWRTSDKMAREIGIGETSYVKLGGSKRMIYLYTDQDTKTLILALITTSDVTQLVMESVSNSVLKKINKLLGGL